MTPQPEFQLPGFEDPDLQGPGFEDPEVTAAVAAWNNQEALFREGAAYRAAVSEAVLQARPETKANLAF